MQFSVHLSSDGGQRGLKAFSENTQPKEVEKAVISQSFGRNLGTILYFGSKTVKFVLPASSLMATIPADH